MALARRPGARTRSASRRRRAREAHAAAVGLDDLARDREAEAGAGDAALAGIRAEELGEEARLVLVGDAEALIAHLMWTTPAASSPRISTSRRPAST